MSLYCVNCFISKSHWIKNIHNKLSNFENNKQNNDDDLQGVPKRSQQKTLILSSFNYFIK